MILRGIDMRCGDTLLLDPQAINVVFAPQSGREEWRQSMGIVVARHAAIHALVPLGHDGAEIDEHVAVAHGTRVGARIVIEEQIEKIQRVDVVGARPECLCHFHDRIFG